MIQASSRPDLTRLEASRTTVVRVTRLWSDEEQLMADTMQDIMNPGANTDDPRFPQAPNGWSTQEAERQASEEGLTLGDDHWEAIRALQAYFAKDKQPNTRALHDALDERFHGRGGIKHLYAIFPGGPIAQGCRLAGLKPPAGAVDTSFGSVK